MGHLLINFMTRPRFVVKEDVYDIGCMTVKLDQVFISHLPAEEIYQRIKYKLDCREALAEQELMQLIVLPLAGKGG